MGFQAPRMINDFANPVGLQTRTSTELIALQNILAWNGEKMQTSRGQKRAQWLLWTLSWLLLTRVHSMSINHGLLTAETGLSHQHAIDWVTDSIPTTLAPPVQTRLPFLKLSYHLGLYRKWKPDVLGFRCILQTWAHMGEKKVSKNRA